MTPILFWKNDNNLKETHFAPVTHCAPGDPNKNNNDNKNEKWLCIKKKLKVAS